MTLGVVFGGDYIEDMWDGSTIKCGLFLLELKIKTAVFRLIYYILRVALYLDIMINDLW
jgi:hypothetical protein